MVRRIVKISRKVKPKYLSEIYETWMHVRTGTLMREFEGLSLDYFVD